MRIWKDASTRIVAGIAGIFLLPVVSIGLAATPPCDTVLTKNTKFDADMNCPGTALRLVGNGSEHSRNVMEIDAGNNEQIVRIGDG